jgi:cytochrome c-type biogenesis protein CcmH/NrfG
MIRAESDFQVKTPATHLQLAERLNQQGDPNGAIEEYRAAIQLDPGLASAFLGLGAVYLDQHEWKQAEDAFERAGHFDRENSQIEYWLGRSRLAQHKFPEAMNALQAALRLNPHDAEAFSDLGLTYMALGEPMDAIRALRQAIRLQPDFSEAHARLELAEAFKLNQALLSEETAIILDLLFRKE